MVNHLNDIICSIVDFATSDWIIVENLQKLFLTGKILACTKLA